jgi:hypothetical protein
VGGCCDRDDVHQVRGECEENGYEQCVALLDRIILRATASELSDVQQLARLANEY